MQNVMNELLGNPQLLSSMMNAPYAQSMFQVSATFIFIDFL